ncbi:APC family permease [Pseudokordiimonas caeni]|uniref:APC family permease n=1 Tax=Pseudokordiimonas caeni TaxID=2997908 RepID=UPI002811FC90|nr:amino acid permease [Pseudokordiimonas caeni]
MSDDIPAARPFGFWQAWALVVGSAIGSGVFMMPALLAPYGLLGLGGWLISGVGIMLVALNFARMSARLPKLGGPYAYARGGLGDFAGFLIAWGFWISQWTAISAVAVAAVGYMAFFLPVLKEPVPALAAGLACIWALAFLNLRSLDGVGKFQLVTTILKVLPLALIVVAGGIAAGDAALPEMNPSGGNPISVLATSAMLTMWALVGMEAVTVPAEAIQNPEKTIARALVVGVITLLVIYFASSAAVMFLIPGDVLAASTAPFADAATVLIGPVGASVVAIGAIIATVGVINSFLLVSGQVLVAPAREGLIPAWFGKLSRHGTPARVILISATLASLLMAMNYTKGLVAAFEFMILLSTLTTLIPYVFTAVAEMWFIKQDIQKGDRSARVKRNLVLAVLAFLATLFIIIGSGAETVFWGFMLLIIGMPVYVLAREDKTQGGD